MTIFKFWWIFTFVEGGEFVVKLVAAKVIRQYLWYALPYLIFLYNNLWNKYNMIVLVHKKRQKYWNIKDFVFCTGVFSIDTQFILQQFTFYLIKGLSTIKPWNSYGWWFVEIWIPAARRRSVIWYKSCKWLSDLRAYYVSKNKIKIKCIIIC